MRIDNLLPVLVPLMFIALWAITSIFNRDAQPLPTRTARPPGPGFDPRGQRPQFPQRSMAMNDPRQASSGGSAVAKAGAIPRDSDMMLMDFKSSSPSKEAEAGLRRFSKNRKKTGSKPSIKETSTSSGMSRSMGESISETVGSGLALSPLALPPSPLLQQNSGPLSTMSVASTSTSQGPTTRELDIRSLLLSRSRLQEAWILSEVLRPPLALRIGGRQRT